MLHIIICHELALIDMFWPRLMVSSKFFQVVFFFHFVYNSALFFAPCCFSFFLHVVENFICISFVSRQRVLLSALPKFPHSFCGQKECTQLFFWKVLSRVTSIIFKIFFMRVKISLPFKRMGTASALCTFIFENFLTKVDLKVFRFPSFWENCASFCWISFSCYNYTHVTHV